MKILFISLLLITIIKVYAQESRISSRSSEPAPKIFIRCGASVSSSDQPLFVVDGIPVDSFQLSGLQPDDIRSIDILASSKASALYGCRAAKGVIVITTKSGSERKLKIEDATDFTAIAGATVIMRKGTDTSVLIADKKGVVRYQWNSAMSGTEIEISCIGYENKCFRIQNVSNATISLKRKINEMDSVVIQGEYGHRRVCGCRLCSIRVKSFIATPESAVASYAVFPNPARRGNSIQIKLTTPFKGKIQLFNMAGQEVHSEFMETGKSRILNYVLPSVAAGSYIVRLTDSAKNSIHTEKLIVQ